MAISIYEGKRIIDHRHGAVYVCELVKSPRIPHNPPVYYFEFLSSLTVGIDTSPPDKAQYTRWFFETLVENREIEAAN